MKPLAHSLNRLTQEIETLEHFTSIGRSAFFDSEVTQYAVTFGQRRIGEIIKYIPAEIRANHTVTEWESFVEFGDFLIDHYDQVVPSQVWEAVTKLPALKAAVEVMLRDAEADNAE